MTLLLLLALAQAYAGLPYPPPDPEQLWFQRCEQVRDEASRTICLISVAFPGYAGAAYRVARCESSLDPQNVSPDGANLGLMQINVVHEQRWQASGYRWQDMLLPWPNLVVARSLWQERGWAPWSCSP